MSPDVERSTNVDRPDPKSVLEGVQGTTLAARLRPLWPDIEARLKSGVSHESVVAALKEAGIDVTLETFRKNLYRTRKERKNSETEKGVPILADSREERNGNCAPVIQPPQEARADETEGTSSSKAEAIEHTTETSGELELPHDFLTNESSREKFADQYLERSRTVGLRRKKT